MNKLGESGNERASQVITEIIELRDSLRMLSDAQSTLLSRLSPVVKTPETAKCVSPGVPCEELVPLAVEIREFRYSVQNMISEIDSTLNRIEL